MRNPANLPPAIQAKAQPAIASMKSTMARAIARKVIIGLGTDASVYPHGRNAKKFAQLVAMGVTALCAIRAGTSVDAVLLGISTQLGTLESGKLADIVAVPGDTSIDIHRMEKAFFLMKEGTLYRNDGRH